MTFEEIQEALADLPEPDSVVDKEEYDKMKKLKDEASKEASSWKKKYNSTLSEKEQLQIAQNEANEELQNNYDALLRKTTIAERKAELVELGYDTKLAQEWLMEISQKLLLIKVNLPNQLKRTRLMNY